MSFKKVLKFGGTSVGTAEAVKKTCEIILREMEKGNAVVVVVSAAAGVTDALLKLQSGFVKDTYSAIADKLQVAKPAAFFEELDKKIFAACLLDALTPKTMDMIVGFGEKISANIVAQTLNKMAQREVAREVWAKGIIITDDNFQNAKVDFEASNLTIRRHLEFYEEWKLTPVVTGFIGSTPDWAPTTLGRGGSDYSAAILGAALDAREIEIWTDVSGIMSADPRIVGKEARVLDEISYEEAIEMARAGAKVIHPETMLPAIKKGIPIVIKNTFDPDALGTRIVATSKDQRIIKNISTVSEVTLLNVRGILMAGKPGNLRRVSGALASAKINIIFVAQDSTEHTICLAVNAASASRAVKILKDVFREEIKDDVFAIEARPECAIVSVIGDGMRGSPGTASAVLGVLGKRRINVLAIAQGSSERTISFVIAESSREEAVKALHGKFFGNGKLAVFIAGTGNIGKETLCRLAKEKDVIVCGIANSKHAYIDANGIDLDDWEKILSVANAMTLDDFINKAKNTNAHEKVFIDCTGKVEAAEKYESIFGQGFNIVTPSKQANTLPVPLRRRMRAAQIKNNVFFGYSASVGAGLPIIKTVRELKGHIVMIEGLFSGSLCWQFNNLDGLMKFSELIKVAEHKGYTEPDPREDCSGIDVARKLVTLANELGVECELNDVVLEDLNQPDEYFAKRLYEAEKRGCVLRYVGTISGGKLWASLRDVPRSDYLAGSKGTNNICAIYTDLSKEPIIIAGPGAGKEVTAAAIVRDVRVIANNANG